MMRLIVKIAYEKSWRCEMNEKQDVGQLIKMLNEAIERRANNMLRQNSLTLVQVWVLLSLDERKKKTCSFKELEKILGVAQSTCAGIINRMAAKNLVESYTDPEDRRMKLLRVTAEGERCCQEAKEDMENMEKLLLQGFSEEDKTALNALLMRAYENIR